MEPAIVDVMTTKTTNTTLPLTIAVRDMALPLSEYVTDCYCSGTQAVQFDRGLIRSPLALKFIVQGNDNTTWTGYLGNYNYRLGSYAWHWSKADQTFALPLPGPLSISWQWLCDGHFTMSGRSEAYLQFAESWGTTEGLRRSRDIVDEFLMMVEMGTTVSKLRSNDPRGELLSLAIDMTFEFDPSMAPGREWLQKYLSARDPDKVEAYSFLLTPMRRSKPKGRFVHTLAMETGRLPSNLPLKQAQTFFQISVKHLDSPRLREEWSKYLLVDSDVWQSMRPLILAGLSLFPDAPTPNSLILYEQKVEQELFLLNLALGKHRILPAGSTPRISPQKK